MTILDAYQYQRAKDQRATNQPDNLEKEQLFTYNEQKTKRNLASMALNLLF
jgi:hypothetical protein